MSSFSYVPCLAATAEGVETDRRAQEAGNVYKPELFKCGLLSARKLADPYLREKGPWATGEKLPEGVRLPRGEWPRGRGGALSLEASAEPAALILP